MTESAWFSYLARLVNRESIVNITVENLAPCKKLLRVELDAKAVDEIFDSVTKDYQKQASLPGFRPGKAPRDLVLKKYEADIKDDAKRKLIGEQYRKAIEEKKISVDRPAGHRGNPVRPRAEPHVRRDHRDRAGISTAGIQGPAGEKRNQVRHGRGRGTRAGICSRSSTQNSRPPRARCKLGDVAVVNYTGTCDGKPITETAPTAKGLTEQKNFWVDIAPDTFIAGFAEQLTGAEAGDKRTVNVDFPADFVTKELAGKKGVFEVEVVEVKEKMLPPIDDALAEKLRRGKPGKAPRGRARGSGK